MMALEKSLQINTLREFELLGEETPSPLLLERLRSCCLVVEALGYQVQASGVALQLLPWALAAAPTVADRHAAGRVPMSPTRGANVANPAASPTFLQARDELIDAVCKREMGVYTQVGPAAGQALSAG